MSIKEQRIHEGIILYTETVNAKEISMSILNEILKVLVFTIDLTGSRGVTLRESPTLVNTVEIDPRSKVVIATIALEANWKLSTKFRFTLKPPNPEVAKNMIEKEVKRLDRKIAQAKKELRLIDYNTFDPSTISSSLGSFIDPYFPPDDSSINKGTDKVIDTVIQWRRPHEFLPGDFKVFDTIEPNDIKQGKLGDCWFMCALASLAERPELVERLFITKESSPQGFYQVRFCKSGEWVRVTIDDYFPCFPKDNPIFSRSHGNELWVLLLEKAYAKLHGSYSLLRGGWAAEGMMDLTGCPTLSIEFTTEEGQSLIKADQIWELLKKYDDSGALISASTAGEDRFTEAGGPQKKGGLVPGHAYTVIIVKEALNNRLINIRNPWGTFEWDGSWSDKSELWTPEMIELVKPILDENDGTFWMSYQDFITHFNGINICRVDSYHEARIKGIFERNVIEDNEWVSSKHYYVIQSKSNCNIIIGLHQEDARNYGVDERRPYLDLGIVVLDVNEGAFKLYKAKECVSERQVELEIQIEANKPYLVWPRTTGCSLSRPKDAKPSTIKWYDNGELDPLFESSIQDVFRKSNKVLGEELSYIEFSYLMEKVNVRYSEEEFQELLARMPSFNNGFTSEGLIEYIREMCEKRGENTVREWMRVWGYDEDLYSIKSRFYVLTFHSDSRIKVQMKNAEGLQLNDKIHEILLQRSAEKKGVTDRVQLYCLMEKAANSFTYGALNDNTYRVKVTLDCANSEGLIFNGPKFSATHFIEPKQWKLLIHCQIAKNATSCKLRPSFKVSRA